MYVDYFSERLLLQYLLTANWNHPWLSISLNLSLAPCAAKESAHTPVMLDWVGANGESLD